MAAKCFEGGHRDNMPVNFRFRWRLLLVWTIAMASSSFLKAFSSTNGQFQIQSSPHGVDVRKASDDQDGKTELDHFRDDLSSHKRRSRSLVSKFGDSDSLPSDTALVDHSPSRMGFVGLLKKLVHKGKDTFERNDVGKSVSLAKFDEAEAVSFLSDHAYAAVRVTTASSMFSISFKIKAVHRDGLLMYGLTSSASGYLAIELSGGYLRYICDIEGTGPRLLPMKYRLSISDNKWHEISLFWSDGTGHLLRIDNVTMAEVMFPLQVYKLRGELFVGGVSSDMFTQLPKKIRSRRGFQGCFSSLLLDGVERHLLGGQFISIPIEFKDQIRRGCRDSMSSCLPNLCVNGGDCIEGAEAFACACDMMSFAGPSCSDDSIAYSFGERGGLILFQFPEDSQPNTKEDAVAFGLSTLQSDAVLLRITSSSFKDLIEIALTDGYVSVKYNLGYADHHISDTVNKVNDDIYHSVRFSRVGANAKLQIDDYQTNLYTALGHQLSDFDSQSQIEVGATIIHIDGKDRFIRPFRGTLVGLVVNGIRILDLAAEGDSRITIEGDIDLDTKPLKLFHSVPQLFSPEFGGFEESDHDLVYTNTSETDDDEEKEEHHFKEWHKGEVSFYDDLIYTSAEDTDCQYDLSCYDTVMPSDALILPVINRPQIRTSNSRSLSISSTTLSSGSFSTSLQKISDNQPDKTGTSGELPCNANYNITCQTTLSSHHPLSWSAFTTRRQQSASVSAQNHDISLYSQISSVLSSTPTFTNTFPPSFSVTSQDSDDGNEIFPLHTTNHSTLQTTETDLDLARDPQNVEIMIPLEVNIGLVSGMSISICILTVVLFYVVCKCCRMHRSSAVPLHESKNYGKSVDDDRKLDETNRLLRTNFTFSRQRDVREWYV